MELTEFEVDSIYSRCLMELLQEGYVALFNYKGKNDSEIVLAKDGVINEFKVTETPWKGYRKNVSICTTKNGWTLTNVNGKTTYVRKGSRWHDLKRA